MFIINLGNIVRGVQCTYSHPYGTISSPLIYAGYEKSINQEKEKCTTINLLRDGKIYYYLIISQLLFNYL